MGQIENAVNGFKIRAGSHMEGSFKRLCALCCKGWGGLTVPLGVGFMLFGLWEILDGADAGGHRSIAPFAVGVTLSIVGSLLWMLGRRLDAAAYLIRHRRQQNKIIRLAQQRGGRLMITEIAVETGLAVEEVEEILTGMAHRGYVEVEVSDSGIVVYRFPEALFAHEKHWSRGVESAG